MRRYESDRHSEYRARIDRVIAHIDGHLGEDLSLAQLAQIACVSEYHFHRLFRGIVGETLNEFVERRRLETAARDIYLNPKAKVIDVALKTCYENPTSFFKALHRQLCTSRSRGRNQVTR